MMDRTFLVQILLVCNLHDIFGMRADLEDTSACNTGEFGNHCQYNCSSSCNFNKCIISSDRGVPECDKGCKEYYTGIFCQEFCPSLCLECNQTRGTCKKCIDGYYGVTCNQTCDKDCLNGTCNIDGSCFLAPKTDGHNTRAKRAKRAKDEGLCQKMTEDGSVCQCCMPGLRGDNCDQVCENCKTFYIPNKECKYLCKDGYYGQTCTEICPESCQQGNSGQPFCENTDGILQCKNGCKRGKTGLQCSQKCSENCKLKTCFQMDGICVDCPKGKYGDMCSDTCSSGCVNETCNRSGTCTDGCKTGMFGKSCSKTCPETCFTCRDNITTGLANCLSDCKPGYHGSLCQDKCNEGCQNNTCNNVDGRCVLGCKPGYYDIRCNKKCSEECHGNTCTIEDGRCANGCKPGYYDIRCDKKCSQECKDNICSKVDGKCVFGCKPGYYDIRCNKKCSEECHGNTCSIENGSCLGGCNIGFYRDNCTGVCGINCVNKKCEDTFDGANPDVPFLCSEGCKNGYKGRSCNQNCSEHCMFCKQLSDDKCMKCDDGYIRKSDDHGRSSCSEKDPELAMSHAVSITVTISLVCIIVFVCSIVIYKWVKRRRPSSPGSCIGAGSFRTENRGRVDDVELTLTMGRTEIMEEVTLMENDAANHEERARSNQPTQAEEQERLIQTHGEDAAVEEDGRQDCIKHTAEKKILPFIDELKKRKQAEKKKLPFIDELKKRKQEKHESVILELKLKEKNNSTAQPDKHDSQIRVKPSADPFVFISRTMLDSNIELKTQ